MTLVIAHRGASHDAAEQTRTAFALALEQGADGVECDVRLTADGHVVCFHDDTTDRTLGSPGVVAELTLDELRSLAGAELLTLAQLVDLVRDAGRPVVLAVELKHPNPFGLALEAAVLAVLDGAGWDRASGRVADALVSLMSFNPLSVAALGVDPRLVMILTADVTADQLGLPEGADTAAAAEQLEAALLGGRQLLDAGAVGGAGPELGYCRTHPDLVRSWIAAGLRVRVWTADEPDDVEFLVGLGVHEITTNRPAEVRAHLDRG